MKGGRESMSLLGLKYEDDVKVVLRATIISTQMDV